MMKAVNTLRVQKGRSDEVLDKFTNAKSVHTFEGFVLMEVLRKENTEDYDELEICTTWKDHASFEAWRKNRAAEKAHRPKKAQADNPILGSELNTFEVFVQHHPAEK